MKRILLYLILIVSITSCRVLDPSIMLKTSDDYQFDKIPDSLDSEYRLAKNDVISFRLFSNDGFKLIDVGGGTGGQNVNQNVLSFVMSYQLDFEGFAKLPILGKTQLIGYTLREAEKYLEEKYSEFYNKPFVMLTISSRRVIVFPGQSGKATVVPLTNENMTLLEVLALVGGLGNDAQAHIIKVIRGENENRQVFLVDLSTIEGIKEGSMVIQSNDIIYVEPRVKVIREILNEIAPAIQLLSSTVTLITTYFLIKNLTAN